MADPEDPDEENAVDLQLLGHEGSSCERLKISSGPLDKISASVIQMPNLSFALNAIRYTKYPNQKTFGEYVAPFGEEWNFTPEEPVIGLYGLMNPLDNSVVQLGFVTLDIKCQEYSEQRKKTGGGALRTRIEEDEEDDSLMTFIIIGAAVVIGVVSVVIIVVILCKGK